MQIQHDDYVQVLLEGITRNNLQQGFSASIPMAPSVSSVTFTGTRNYQITKSSSEFAQARGQLHCNAEHPFLNKE